MAEKKFGGSRFLVLGAAYWLVVAALFAIVHYIRPELTEGASFKIGAVLAAVIGGFVIVYLFRPK